MDENQINPDTSNRPLDPFILTRLLERMPIGAWVMNREGKIVSGNEQARQIWAGARYVSPEDFGKYKGWWHDTKKPISTEEWAAYRAIKHGAVSINEKIEIEAFDGTRKLILNSAFPLRGRNNEIIGAIILNQDISEEIQLKKELQTLYQEMQGILRQSPFAFLVIDRAGQIHMSNAYAERLFGYQKNELKNVQFGQIVPEWEKCHCVDNPGSNEKCVFDFTAKTRGGNSFTVEMQISDLTVEGKGLLLVSLRETRAWDAITKKLTDLLSAERRFREKAEEAVRARNQLLAEISHDLKNHIQAVAAHLTLLDRSLGSSEQEKQTRIQGASNAVQRMRVLLRDLLDAESMESGMFSVKNRQEPVQLESLIGRVLNNLAPLANEKDLSIKLKAPESLPPAFIDESRISRVLENLLGNAIKFSPDKSSIKVSLRPIGGYIECIVSDNGPGVEPEIVPFIFERFVVSSSTAKYGIGLGLPIAKGIVEAHGGQMWLEENKPHGAAFHFTLPVAIQKDFPLEERPLSSQPTQ